MPGPFVHNIDPVIGQIGGMYLWWYGLAYTLSFLGLFHWLRTVRVFLGMNVRQVYDLTILIAGGALIGGRALEVLIYEWSYYSVNPQHVPWIWLGGMSTHGILLGGTLGAWLFCRLHWKSFIALADEIVFPAALMMGLGRIGNFIDGQIAGSVTDVWWAVKLPDMDGFRHPVVLYDGLKNLLLIPILLIIRHTIPRRGVLLGSFLLGYGLFRVLIDFFREYRVDLFGLPPGQQFNIAMAIIGAMFIIWSFRKRAAAVSPLSRSVVLNGLNMDVRQATRGRRVILRALLIVPLVIPSDWTQDVPARYGKRHAGMTHSAVYPKLDAAKHDANGE